MKIQPWHRRHVIHVVSELPDDAEDALIVLRLATELVTDFLSSVVETAGEDRDRRADRRQ
ncbi:hypothetical protein [Bradyrhizobium elkanii]|uniref:hypothetical protein n=1 Tax=Bradyrhizobium elkanii TaxID=29448 RepID=UPI003512FB4A